MTEDDPPPDKAARRPVSSRETGSEWQHASRNLPQRRDLLAFQGSWSWLVLTLLSLGVLMFVFVAWQYLHDEPRGADDDLRPLQALDQTPVIQMPKKVKQFLETVAPFPSGTMPTTPPWLWETPTLSRFFKGNGAALDNLRDLLEDPDWHAAHASWHAADLGSDLRWSVVFVLKQAESAYLSRLGQEEGAFMAAIDLVNLAKRLEKIWAWPSFYSRALEAQELAAQTLAELLKQTRIPEATLRQYQRQFSLCLPSDEWLVQALGAFYLHEKKLLFGPASGEPLDTMPGGVQLERPRRLFFKPHSTLQLFVDQFRRLRMEAQAPLANTGLISVDNAISMHSRRFQPNAEGVAYCTNRMSAYRSLPARLGLAKARGALLVTLFAMRRCVAEQRTLPPSLESLRPKYLFDVPLDPFSAAPLHYDIRLGRIWSVGADLKSQGGAPTSPPMSDDKEPTVEIDIGITSTD